jgi:mRNA-degrading endonuclease RelE of RelBE toxin-antitoxin system
VAWKIEFSVEADRELNKLDLLLVLVLGIGHRREIYR